MSYISLKFLYLVVATLILYYVFPLKYRKWVLLFSSLGFYALSVGYLVIFPIISCFFAWCYGRFFLHKKGALFIGIAANLIPLIFFKWGIWTYNLVSSKEPLTLLIPLGISFYTLSLISYCADLDKGLCPVEENFFNLLLFTSFFPVIIQGPIHRFRDLEKQLITGHCFEYKSFVFGLQLMFWGLFKKIVIADWVCQIVNVVYEMDGELGGFYVILAFIMYSIQLYSDFSGCVDISRGVSELFGISLSPNFKSPYLALSIQDFWRRWHISLSSFLRDYVYIPLGGNRKGPLRKQINTLITFLVSGIWHGVGVQYILWGLGHGCLVIYDSIICRLPVYGRLYKGNSAKAKLLRILKRIICFVFVTFLWGLFRAGSVKQFLHLIKAVPGGYGMLSVITNPELFELSGLKEITWLAIMLFALLALIVDILHERGLKIREFISQRPLFVRWAIYTLAVFAIINFGMYGPFYEFTNFIYGNF